MKTRAYEGGTVNQNHQAQALTSDTRSKNICLRTMSFVLRLWKLRCTAYKCTCKLDNVACTFAKQNTLYRHHTHGGDARNGEEMIAEVTMKECEEYLPVIRRLMLARLRGTHELFFGLALCVMFPFP